MIRGVPEQASVFTHQRVASGLSHSSNCSPVFFATWLVAFLLEYEFILLLVEVRQACLGPVWTCPHSFTIKHVRLCGRWPVHLILAGARVTLLPGLVALPPRLLSNINRIFVTCTTFSMR